MGCSFSTIKFKAMQSGLYDETLKEENSFYAIRNIYYSNFQLCLRDGITGGDNESNKICNLQRKVLQIISGVGNHISCRQIFKDYNYEHCFI
jgi:hypothetical protein